MGSATCTARLTAFNTHCARTDATSQWGLQPEACEDTIVDCDVHKANGGCLDANGDHDNWRTYCVKTCEYCSDPQYNPQACGGYYKTQADCTVSGCFWDGIGGICRHKIHEATAAPTP